MSRQLAALVIRSRGIRCPDYQYKFQRASNTLGPLDVDEYICPAAATTPVPVHTRHDVSLLRMVRCAERRHLRGDRAPLSDQYGPIRRLESKPDFHLREPPNRGCVLRCRPSHFYISGKVGDGQHERAYLNHFDGSSHDRVALSHP